MPVLRLIAIFSILTFESGHQIVEGEQQDHSYSLNSNFKYREPQPLVTQPEAAATTRYWATLICTVVVLIAISAVVAILLSMFASSEMRKRKVPAGGKARFVCSSKVAEGVPDGAASSSIAQNSPPHSETHEDLQSHYGAAKQASLPITCNLSGDHSTHHLISELQPDVYDLTSQDSPRRTPTALESGVSTPYRKSKRPPSLSNWWGIANEESEDQQEVSTFDMATEDTPCTTPCLQSLSKSECEGKKRPSLSSWWIDEAILSPN